jgi:dienelactone hydrolase
MKVPNTVILSLALPVLFGAACSEPTPRDETRPMEGSAATDERVVLESDGWQLMGEWRAPPARERVPAALLLHRAAGSRGEYAALADALARRGVASLRLDLRGHGESDNLGRFEEPFAENRHILEKTYKDVDTALGWIKAHPAVAASRVAVAGASYSGEAIGEALREGGESAAAYVILSPGSFSDASIAEVDRSDVPWLFMRTTQEDEVSLPFIDVVFEALESGSESAEIRVVSGAGHATRILDAHPFIVEEIADWVASRLDASWHDGRNVSDER